MAVLVTPCYPETAGRKLSQQSAKRNPFEIARDRGRPTRRNGDEVIM
jgi:hypothetical protein